MQVKHKGAASELIALIWLLGQDYEVYRNVSQHGICDMIAVKGEEIIKIDVKSGTDRKLGGFHCIGPTEEQIKNNVSVLAINPENSQVYGWVKAKPKPVEKVCPACGKTFITTKSDHKHCSRYCKGVSKRKQNKSPASVLKDIKSRGLVRAV